ncbi:conserved protein of unknown function [Magnetospirillum sp. XM-1]|uniref:hypothetical protein n=1 Tax=Magnetospirillum sp. XM-1 TaxID=1663591 RepID=UPI00073E0334|nr:hypothetical protein [Magnetospirillum sp. XM-1]CUW39296.1 conserved protein of unknown function [Magnetospirillum sp. XM-1]
MMDQAAHREVRTVELCPELADDILRGADQIAAYLFGDVRHRRKVYHLAENTKFPMFRLGSILCARKSTLRQWIEDQEKAARR